MNPKRVTYQTLKYLMSEGEDKFMAVSQGDILGKVKFTLTKMGYPPSLIPDEDIQGIEQLVWEGLQELQNSHARAAGKKRMIKKEAWYIEAEERLRAICPTDPAEKEDVDKERSHLPGDGRLKPEPFRKEPKKLV